jgi:hypothetical protein
MVAARRARVEENAMQQRRLLERHARLLLKFARQRLPAGLPDLDAPAGKMPAGDVAVPDQKHFLVAVDHHRPPARRASSAV